MRRNNLASVAVFGSLTLLFLGLIGLIVASTRQALQDRAVLQALEENGGRADEGRLQDLLRERCDAAVIDRAVARLESQGHIKRETFGDDRYALDPMREELVLTSEGRAHLEYLGSDTGPP